MAAGIMERAYVWDRFVRLHHWSLATLVLANHFILDGPAHRWAGYAALALVCARLVWGVAGSPHARFAAFLPTPARLRAHFARPGVAPRGHNPLGAAMMLAMLALVVSLGITGWLMRSDAYWGEAWLEDLHQALANGLLVCAALHVAGVAAASLTWRINLPRAMLTGYKVRSIRSAPFEDRGTPGPD
ncbi:MAG: hypothetical protein BGP20_00875 [Thiobacillus sp. 63-78]|nr:MAG: hypothetical protein BGP20_00875 [Thiobacillus sp. 63-78]